MTVQVFAVALFFAAIGVYAVAWPAKVYKIFGVVVESADGRNEIRAVYGGMCLAMAGILFAAPDLGAATNGVLITIMIILVGMAAGRLFSFLIERTSIVPVAFMIAEFVGAGLLYSVADFGGSAFV